MVEAEAEALQRIDRYRVEALLGQGATGEVYRVLDETNGRRVALKRLVARDAMRRLFFEREYHTLASLRHPCIVQVYDYRLDDQYPYYTMELIEGDDLTRLAPLPYVTACRHLRDVASALALLHSRRLLHRDVYGKNVRVSADGKAKLIDFGTLCAFGIQETVAGTPPCIPPEAFRGASLDHRADLFGFGALAYHTLTGRHAFPAQQLSELRSAWTHPPQPASSIVKTVPKALSALVSTLLSIDPGGRPESAAEVIERLEAIADLEPEETRWDFRRYLPEPALVGREAQLDVLANSLDRVRQKRQGGAVLIQGSAGVGGSRLLSECAVRAQILGLSVIQVRIGHAGSGQETSRALARAALLAAPRDAPCRERLAALLDEPHVATAADRTDAQERAARRLVALRGALLELTSGNGLALFVDDAHLADDETLRLLAMLAQSARTSALVVLAVLSHPLRTMAGQALLGQAETMPLAPLSGEQSAALVQAVFGEVPHRTPVATWLFAASGGNPAQAMEALRHLARRGTIRYIGGTWVLPASLTSEPLPRSAADSLRASLADLEPPVRNLAEKLSVHEGRLSLPFIRAVASPLRAEELFARLRDLVVEGILVAAADDYSFSSESVRRVLFEGLSGAARRSLHRQTAEALLANELRSVDRLAEAGWHLIRAGDELRGAELLAKTAVDFADPYGRLQTATPALEAALGVCRRHGGGREMAVQLLLPLVVAGMYADRSLVERHGPEALDALLDLTGLGSDPETAAESRHFHSLLICASAVISVAQACADVASAQRVLRKLEPMRALAPRSVGGVAYRVCLGLSHLTAGCDSEAYETLRSVVATLKDPSQSPSAMPDHLHTAYTAGMLNGCGMVLASGGNPEAVNVAAALEGLGFLTYRAYAAQILAIYHASRGEAAAARQHEECAETYALEGAVSWRAYVWLPTRVVLTHHLTGDVVALKRLVQQLSELASDIPSLATYRDAARVCHRLQRGRPREAVDLHERTLGDLQPGAHSAWVVASGAYAQALNAIGDHERARTISAATLEALHDDAARLVVPGYFIARQLAVAEMGLGDREAGTGRLRGLLERFEASGNPLVLGSLHRDLALIGRHQRDPMQFEHHRQKMESWFASTGHPVLLAQNQQLVTSNRRSSDPPGVRRGR